MQHYILLTLVRRYEAGELVMRSASPAGATQTG